MAGMVIRAGVTVRPSAVPPMLIRSAGSAAASALIAMAKVPVPVDDSAGMVRVVRGRVMR